MTRQIHPLRYWRLWNPQGRECPSGSSINFYTSEFPFTERRPGMKIIQAKNYEKMSRFAANIVSAQVILFPRSVLGLATGDTPVGMYKQLIDWNHKGDVDFSNVITVNLDEYIGLPKDHQNSYAYFMMSNFFNDININRDNIFLPNGLADDVELECARYEEIIKEIGGIDLQVLGLGHNGHIGFNEPNTYFKKSTHKVKLSESTISSNSRFFANKQEMPKARSAWGWGPSCRRKGYCSCAPEKIRRKYCINRCTGTLIR